MSQPKLTPEMVAVYVKNGGVKCPFCRSKDLDCDAGVEVDGPVGTREVSCGACHRDWRDVFYLGAVDVWSEGDYQTIMPPDDLPEEDDACP